MAIEKMVHTRFDTSDLTEWIIGKTGYDAKICLLQDDGLFVPLDKDYAQSLYPELGRDRPFKCEAECPGIIVFTKLSNTLISFITKYQFADEGLQHVTHAKCRMARTCSDLLDHPELRGDDKVYRYDNLHVVCVRTLSLICDFLHDKFPKEDKDAAPKSINSIDLQSSPDVFDCKFSASWIVSNDND